MYVLDPEFADRARERLATLRTQLAEMQARSPHGGLDIRGHSLASSANDTVQASVYVVGHFSISCRLRTASIHQQPIAAATTPDRNSNGNQ